MWLEKHGGEAKYGAEKVWDGDWRNEQWLAKVKGAILLHDLFQDLSNAKEEYRKVTHGAALTEWICENDLAYFAGLANYLRGLLQ
jgi:hypothetical protein